MKYVMILLCFLITIHNDIMGNSIKISSSSVLDNNSCYSNKNVFDGDPNTAWAEGDEGNGENEWMQFEFKKERSIGYLSIINGYARSSKDSGENDIWLQNNRVKTAELRFSDSSVMKIILDDVREKQYININKISKSMKFTIKSVYNGIKYHDACISELNTLFGCGYPTKSKVLKMPDTKELQRIDFPEYDFVYTIGPFILSFLEGVSSYFGNEPNTNVSVIDTICEVDKENLNFHADLCFKLSSGTVKILDVSKRIEYRHWFGLVDEGSHYWLGNVRPNDSPKYSDTLLRLTRDLSYYSHWEKLLPNGKKYNVFDSNFVFESIYIDSIEIAVYPDKKKEEAEGKLFYKELESDYSFLKEKKHDLKIVAIKSLQLRVSYLEKSKIKRMYIIISRIYST